MKLVVGITGASGSVYGVRMMEVLHKSFSEVETHLVISNAGLTPKIEGSGAVVSQSPDPGTVLYKKAVCMLKLK